MPVNLQPAQPERLFPVAGVELGIAMAGVRKPNRKDVLLMRIAPGATVAGVFTQNRFCAAPVLVCREHLDARRPGRSIRALVINTGCANAGTGDQGIAAARRTCDELAAHLKCSADQVLPFSTGVIMEALPGDRLAAGLPACIGGLRNDGWLDAAQAIMTTDTTPKAVSRRVRIAGADVTITGIAKGAGMIRPDMATMLGFIATDAPVSLPALQSLTRQAAKHSFNCITVDGDTSTNDSFIVIATGRAPLREIDDVNGADFIGLGDAVTGVASQLAQAIVRDGEGASKFITVCVEEGRDEHECRQVAYAIAHSPLVKTAFFASDPNLGRILAAIGNAGIADLDVAKVALYLDDVLVAERGGVSSSYREADGERVMKQSEITVRVLLKRGAANGILWTCDLSHDYVSINADYRS